jgi:uncharacterized protein YhbP (UPF0306 family)
MSIQRSTRAVSERRLARITRSLLGASTLCAISTVSPSGRPHINTAYFGWGANLHLVWLSDPRARHSRNLTSWTAAAVAVYDSSQSWGNPDRGIQLFGSAGPASRHEAPEAERIYAGRFPGFRSEEFVGYRLYVFRPRTVKLFDEPELGAGVFVTATVRAGGELAWTRTEIYRPT